LISDSLFDASEKQTQWLRNFQNILADELDESYYASDSSKDLSVVNIDLSMVSPEEIKLREKVEAEENLTILSGKRISFEEGEKIRLVPPIDGYVVQRYSLNNNHFGIDIAGSKGEPVKSVYEGIVILSEWNPETGNVMAIQHTNGMVSFYKHNSVLLKKVGSFVKRGEAVAIIGNSGEFTSGPHLHFELWMDGKSINPLDYLNLEQIN
jgi:murein DD-endopeptidase MepM/ murein hydrolase activator NlpD